MKRINKLFSLCQALQAAIKNLSSSIKKRKDRIVAMQTALELDSEVMKPSVPLSTVFVRHATTIN